MRHNPRPQEMYRHFKGNLYQIRCLARSSETREMMVVYQAMYDTFEIYVRPLSMFMDEVDHAKYPEVKQKYRFELLQDIEGAADGCEIQSGEQVVNPQHEVQMQEASDHSREAQKSKTPVNVQETHKGKPAVPAHEAQKREIPVQTQEVQSQESVAEPEEQVNIDPLVLEFLDAGSYEQRLNILAALHNRITDEMINTMAVAVDLEIKEGDVEDRYAELRNCLRTFEKYEGSRLR